MLIRLSLIIAIIAGLAVGVLNFVKVKEKITTLQANLKHETEEHQKFEGQYNQTKRELDATNAVLKVTLETLKSTEDQLTKATAEVAAQTKRGDQLTADLARTKQDLESTQSELASYKASGMTPQQVATVAAQIKKLQASIDTSETENKVLMGKIRRLENELAVYKPNPPPVTLPAAINAKVLVSDPKWNFVVLNVGQDQGVLERGQLLINRNGRLVAKVVVSSVQKDRCVANIIPGWQLGEVLEGDQAIPAFPSS